MNITMCTGTVYPGAGGTVRDTEPLRARAGATAISRAGPTRRSVCAARLR